MMVFAIEQGDANAGVPQPLGSFEASEASSDNDDPRLLMLIDVHKVSLRRGQ
jgi:hypothetical protein